MNMGFMWLRSPGLVLLTVFIAWSGCSTTTHGVVGSRVTADWLNQNKSSPCSVTFKEGIETKPIKGVLATPPTTSRPSPSPATRVVVVSGNEKQEVLLGTVDRLTAVHPVAGLGDGICIGAAVGILLGLGSQLARFSGGESTDGKGGQVLSATVGTTVIGALIGMLVGGSAGHRNILVF